MRGEGVRFPDYGKCKVRSVHLARELQKENILSHVIYGVYKPPTARINWDERWHKSETREFVHFWLQIGSLYYDYSAFQFGAKERIRTNYKDTRYEQLGYYDFRAGELIHMGNLVINWENIKMVNGIPTVQLEPIFI